MKQGWRSLFFLTFPLCIIGSFAPITTAKAQITPDNSLGAENSLVTPDVVIRGIPSDRIDGGASRGANLFHSFQEFNINEGRGGYFSNPAGIDNILSRVTGGNPSNILGTLGVLGNANLFFINPNGIVFGPNASLDMGGSFLGSTANSLLFGNGFEFSASNPQAPPLLTVNIPIGLRFRENPGAIRVQGFGQQAGLFGTSNSFIFPTLEVRTGENLALVGGNVSLDGGVLQAPRGQVEVGGLASPGDIEIQNDGLRFDVLGFPTGVQRADVSLTNQAGINVITDQFDGGSININARNIGISGESLLTDGIAPNLGIVNAVAGNITLNATGETRIDQSRIENNVNFGTIADSSNINIQTGSFVLTNLAQLDASNFGTSESGFAGDIRVNANEPITVEGGARIDSNGFAGRVFLTSANNSVNISNSFINTDSNVDNTGSNFSLIEITAPQGSISLNQTTLNSTNSGIGLAGDIRINARDQIFITNSSNISSTGNNGRIFIGRNDLFNETSSPREVRIDNSTLSSINRGISTETTTINAGDISIVAIDSISLNRSEINTFTERLGNAGNVTLQAENGEISLADGSLILSTVQQRGIGDGGDINIIARTFSLTDGAQLQSSVFGQGDAGSISVQASGEVLFTGFSNIDLAGNQGLFPSGILSTVETGGRGNAGDINISARTLSLTDGAELQTLVRQASGTNPIPGAGFAGDISIVAIDSISLNRSAINTFTEQLGNAGNVTLRAENGGISLADGSLILSTVQQRGIGDGGDINIIARTFSLTDGAQLQSSVFGQGDAGSISVQASGEVLFTGFSNIDLAGNQGLFPSGILSTVETGGRGNAGDINISARTLSLTDGAELQTLVRGSNQENSAVGVGNAGDIFIDVVGDVTITSFNQAGNRSAIFTDVERGASGNAGNITITSQTGSVFLNNLAQLSSTNESNGFAGDIRINASNQVSLDQSSTIRSDGNLGRIFIGQSNVDAPSSVPSVISINNSTLSTTNSGTRFAGDIVLNARDEFYLTNQSIISSNGNFGRIFIGENTEFGVSSSPRVVRIDNSTLSSTNSGVIGAEGTAINAGDVSIVAIDSISLVNRSVIQTFTEQSGNAGSVALRAENGEILLADGSAIFSTVEQRGRGDGGDINITARTFSLTGGSELISSVLGEGDAGSISIQVSGPVLFAGLNFVGNQEPFPSGVFSRVEVGGIGNGGEITIRAGSLSLNDVSQIVTSTFGRGASGDVSNAGDISVQVDGSITLANLSTIRSSVERGAVGIGGDINVSARSLTLTDGAEITAVVFRAENNQPGGTGRAGNIDINATDFVNISGVSSVQLPFSFSTVGFSSGLATSAERGTTAIGPVAAGNITVTTGDFRLADGAVVNALTDNSGRGGDITINANTFTATGGGQVLATSFNSGRAGDVTLNISDRITLSGFDPNFDQRFEQARIDQARVGGLATDIVNNQGSASGIFANTAPGSQGTGGNLTINTRDLTVEDGATVTVSSPQAQAGNLTISARRIRLDRGSITAETAITGDEPGANITLRDLELLSLLNGSLISARATTDTANGGNIIIDAARGFVVAFPRQNNDIIANASVGRGGNIQITSQGIFGLAVGRSIPRNRTNDIDASSEFGLAGTVNRNTPEVDPSQGFVELPDDVTDPTQQIAQNPCQQGVGSEFIVTGRGGLPTSPNQTLSSDNVRVDLLEPVASTSNSASTSNITLANTSPKVKQIVPAQGWIFNDKGQVVLTAYAPTSTGSQRSWQTSASCAAR